MNKRHIETQFFSLEKDLWTNLKLFRPKLSPNWTKNSQKNINTLKFAIQIKKKPSFNFICSNSSVG